ncbi:MAG: FkbM family methyltransferase [Candidatus Omnitrophica bacterium]|nr:FkbM family methyltransferase [Candidatus Omnitrophota bacterium]
MRRLIKKIYQFLFKPFFKKGLNIKIGNRGPFRMDYIFAFSRFDRIGTGNHNPGFSKWLEACRGKRRVFDIGAHIGLYSLPASREIAGDGYIYAFEPSKANREYLEKHMRFNGIDNVRIYPFLIGERSEDNVSFYENLNEPDDMNAAKVIKNHKMYNKVYRKQVSLDDFCRDENIIPEVIKIDVEGAEIEVLKGAEKMLKKNRPVLFLSVHPKRLSALGSSIDKLTELVHSIGYKAYDVNDNRADKLTSKEYILTAL